MIRSATPHVQIQPPVALRSALCSIARRTPRFMLAGSLTLSPFVIGVGLAIPPAESFSRGPLAFLVTMIGQLDRAATA